MLLNYWEKQRLTAVNCQQELATMGINDRAAVEVIEKTIVLFISYRWIKRSTAHWLFKESCTVFSISWVNQLEKFNESKLP